MARHLAHLRGAAELLGEDLGRAAHGERALLEVARHVQRPSLVAEMALQLAEDRRRGVARELRPAAGLEAVDRLDQAEARDLKQVVEGLVGVRVAQREIARQREETLHELLARGKVCELVVANQQEALGLTWVGAHAWGTALAPLCQRNHNSGCSHLSNLPVVLDSQVRCATALYDCATSPSCTQRTPVRIKLSQPATNWIFSFCLRN